MDVEKVITEVEAYVPRGARAARSREKFLRDVPTLARPFDEEADPRHVTGSAIVVGSRGVVLHKHKRLGLWLQPGGHVEPGETPGEGALRETIEETGLRARHVGGGPLLVHVDVHPGPRGHTHYDLRYLIVAAPDEPSPPEGESQDCRWFSWEQALAVADEGLSGALVALQPLCEFTLMRASSAAAQGVGDVWLRSRVWALPGVTGAHPEPDVRRWVADVLIPSGRTWVAVNGEDGVVGMMTVGDGWIDQLYLDPVVVGFGLGDRFVELAKELSPDGLELWTFQCNGPARRFYGRHGFAEVELTDGSANEEREPDVRMRWLP